jgi:hypothetical protein
MAMTDDPRAAANTTTPSRRRLTTAVWDLNSKGSGTVTYHQFRLPGADTDVWPDSLPGAICERREKGGTFLSSERSASSLYSFDPLPVGTRKITIEVTYRKGSKAATTRTAHTLTGYDGDKGVWAEGDGRG